MEKLKIGDLVKTADHGFQPIKWIGNRRVPATGNMAPIEIQKGALGNNRRLRVSPQHRILIGGPNATLLFGAQEVLVPAKALVNDQTIRQIEGDEVDYFHILFDTHEIVISEGLKTESFHPGLSGFGAMPDETRAEILEIFPELDPASNTYGPTARPCLKLFEGALLVKLGI
ncbi:MAG: Hint domain-containing protein [Pseudomonadota bacterium]